MRLTLLQRPGQANANEFAHALENELASLKGTLSASVGLQGFSKRGWTIIDVKGDDYEIVAELIARKLGLTHTDFSSIELFGNYDGILSEVTAKDLGVDVGLEAPRPQTIRVNLGTLRAQLCDGKNLSMKELTENYCLIPNTKVTVRITLLHPESEIEGWFADSQLALLSNWISMRLDRILVFNCSRREVDLAIKKANIERDTISVEHLTLTTHSVLCKLGTDAVGLMPKLGAVLRNRELKPFIPARIASRCRPW